MMRFVSYGVVGLLILALSVPRAAAEPIQWSYQGQVVVTGPSSGPGFNLGPSTLVGNYGLYKGSYMLAETALVQFAGVSGQGIGPASATAFQMRTPPAPGSGQFNQTADTFNLTVSLTDAASGRSGSLTFHGGVSGSFGSGIIDNGPVYGYASHLQVTFSDKMPQSLELGNHLYIVTISPFAYSTFLDPRQPHDPNWTPYQGVPMQVQVSDVPEPGSLVLLTFGGLGLAGHAWRKRRRNVAPGVLAAGPAQ